MASGLIPPAGALSAQARASDPGASVWVSANAGAGKTFVLTQRVVRLLLSGVPPGAILCLTYTNAAAAEMASRVFAALGAIAQKDDADLDRTLEALSLGVPTAMARTRARTLFAETLETPGGLKVETLHAFAASLLRRFPLEAGLTGSFQILDDVSRAELIERSVSRTLAEAVRDPRGEMAHAIDALLPYLSIAAVRGTLAAALAGPSGLPADRDGLEATLKHALAYTPAGPSAIGRDTCRAIVEAVERSGKSAAFGEALAAALGCPDGPAAFEGWPAIFLNKTGAPKVVTRMAAEAVRNAIPDFERVMADEQDRLSIEMEARRVEDTVAATLPFVALLSKASASLAAEKRARGLLDYDDQIDGAATLLADSTAAAWVRYKLDEGIDHVMIDEAQDTAPAQWQLVEALVSEFFAGESAREEARTLFVVGDEKQSIYSFQGAAPHLFQAKRNHYEGAAGDAGARFEALELVHSFRSCAQLLSAVDAVFAHDPLAAAVNAAPGAVRHSAVRGEPGGVDVWPLHMDEKATEPDDWLQPIDTVAESAGEVQLVKAIADQIEAWTNGQGPLGGERVRPGEIMILARQRGTFSARINRELKTRGIATAGADRLDVTAHIAVKDMVALGHTLLRRDDLSLGAVLKSPLFGFDEDALYAVAEGRDGSLFAALRQGDAAAQEAHATLMRWGRLARTARPFDFYGTLLVGEGRLADFAARMGSEAVDALDAFLDIALGYADGAIDTLETFLFHLERLNVEIRRSPDADSDAVRIMTVHGAKGLEAKVVFLCDNGASPVRQDREARLVAVAAGEDADVPALDMRKELRPERLRRLAEDAETRQRAEHHRLLYVGMTRAERHLVVCGSYKTKKPAPGMWHALVHDALAPLSEPLPCENGEGLAWRWPTPSPDAPAWAAPKHPEAERPDAPDWLFAPPPVAARAPEPIAPSEGHKSAGAADAEETVGTRVLSPADHGTLVHALIEEGHGDLRALADRAHAIHPELSGDAREAIAREVARAVSLPDLTGERLSEMAVMGDVVLPGGAVRRASGRVDLVLMREAELLVVDFKTDRPAPSEPAAVPNGYLTQLAIYRAIIAAAHPDIAVRAAIVWTASGVFMPLTDRLPDVRALARSPA